MTHLAPIPSLPNCGHSGGLQILHLKLGPNRCAFITGMQIEAGPESQADPETVSIVLFSLDAAGREIEFTAAQSSPVEHALEVFWAVRSRCRISALAVAASSLVLMPIPSTMMAPAGNLPHGQADFKL